MKRKRFHVLVSDTLLWSVPTAKWYLIPTAAILWFCGVVLVCGPMAWAADEKSAHQEPFRYDPGTHRDPFLPLVREGRLVSIGSSGNQRAASQPVLYGILWDPGGQSIALINDAEYKVGDTVEGYQVFRIRQDAVVLTGAGAPVELKLVFETPPDKLAPGATTGGKKR